MGKNLVRTELKELKQSTENWQEMLKYIWTEKIENRKNNQRWEVRRKHKLEKLQLKEVEMQKWRENIRDYWKIKFKRFEKICDLKE